MAFEIGAIAAINMGQLPVIAILSLAIKHQGDSAGCARTLCTQEGPRRIECRPRIGLIRPAAVAQFRRIDAEYPDMAAIIKAQGIAVENLRHDRGLASGGIPAVGFSGVTWRAKDKKKKHKKCARNSRPGRISAAPKGR